MTVIVVATVVPLAEHRAAVVSALETAIAQVHAQDAGCELYALHEGDDRLVMIEKWTSQEDLEAHNGGAGLKDLTLALEGKLSSPPDVQLLRPHPAGTAEQGAL